MRITKKLKPQLHTALCMDDVLFEVHRRHNEQLNREAKRLIHDRRKLNKVVGRAKDGTFYQLQVLDVDMLQSGTHILVALP